MGKVEVLSTLIKTYLQGRNETYYNYKLALILLISGIISGLLYIIVGPFSGFIIVFKIVEISLIAHITLSILAVINDYIFDIVLKRWFQGLWLLISFRILLEVLIF